MEAEAAGSPAPETLVTASLGLMPTPLEAVDLEVCPFLPLTLPLLLVGICSCVAPASLLVIPADEEDDDAVGVDERRLSRRVKTRSGGGAARNGYE